MSTTVDIIQRVAARLEAQGVPVAFIDGWEDRGRPSLPTLDPSVVVCHHTATKGYQYDYASLGIVRDGRSDLPGPLSEFGLGRHTGTVYVIASGKANHAGEGGWGGYAGNSTAWGIEAENDGIGEEWGPEIRRSYLLLVAALCVETPIDPANVCEHYEWSPYKIDRANFGDPDEFRAEVAQAMAGDQPQPGGGFLAALTEGEQRELYEWVRDQQQYMTAEKDGRADTPSLMEAIAGVTNDVKAMTSMNTALLVDLLVRFDPGYPGSKSAEAGVANLARIVRSLDTSGK